MKSTEKIVIFGGTFNPPHIGHIKSAEAVSRALNPDKLMIIPDFLPPHKILTDDIIAESRLEMCKLAFSHIKNVEISDIEIKRGGKSYTAVTLQSLKKSNRELYFLCGTDMFLTISSWFRPEFIFESATICLVRRENDNSLLEKILSAKREYENKFNARIIFIEAETVEISSSEIRASFENRNSNMLLPDSVQNYIYEKGLYQR